MFHFVFVHWDARVSILDRLSNNFCAAGTKYHLDFSLCLITFHFVNRATDRTKCGWGPSSHDWLWRVSLLNGKAQLAKCLREPKGIPLGGTQAFRDNAQGVI